MIPSGAEPNRAGDFDLVALQAPDNVRFLPADCPSTLLPPPVFDLASDVKEVVDVPREFGLTVFNNYGDVKGMDGLLQAAELSPVPIVWVCSTRTHPKQIPSALPANVVPMPDRNFEEIWWLYSKAKFYVSFSKTEGFGWAIADALSSGCAVVSRPIGVLTLPSIDRTGVTFYEEYNELGDILSSVGSARFERDLSAVSPSAFIARLTEIVEQYA